MHRLLTFLVLVHCALRVWAIRPERKQLIQDNNDKCRLTAGYEKSDKRKILFDGDVTGRKHGWSRNMKTFRFPREVLSEYNYYIYYIEVIDLDCRRSGVDQGVFATILKEGIGSRRAVINFNVEPKKDYNYHVYITT